MRCLGQNNILLTDALKGGEMWSVMLLIACGEKEAGKIRQPQCGYSQLTEDKNAVVKMSQGFLWVLLTA